MTAGPGTAPQSDGSVKPVLRSQYLASLAMLEESVRTCPDSLWNDPAPQNRFWHVAYHALHFLNLYLSDSRESFEPWARHRAEYQYLGRLPWPPHDEPKITEPYDREAILAYIDFCRERICTILPGTDLTLPSGFSWLPFDKLELQVYSIRHLQHHTGQLTDRLRSAGIGIRWVGEVREPAA